MQVISSYVDDDDDDDDDDEKEEEDSDAGPGRLRSADDDDDDDDGAGYGLIRSRSNSMSQQQGEGGVGDDDDEREDPRKDSWGGVAPHDEREDESEDDPEDAEIRYLEQKLFSGKYRGTKGKKKLEKEWTEKDGFDDEFASFIMGLERGGSSTRSAKKARRSMRPSEEESDEEEEEDDDENEDDDDDEEDEDGNGRRKSDENVVNLYEGRGSGKKLTSADIYGQKPSASEEGATPQKYVPPHMRNKGEGGSGTTVDEARLQRQVNGLFNRCGEDNIESIALAIHGLYSLHPNTLVNASFAKAILDACGDLHALPGNGIQLLEPLVRNAACLTSALNFMVSSTTHSVGTCFVCVLEIKFF